MNNNTLNKTVSDLIDITKLDPNKLNLIIAGTGTGKSYFALITLIEKLNNIDLPDNLKYLKGIKRHEILLVTSRKITELQQSYDYNNVTIELNSNNFYIYKDAIMGHIENCIGTTRQEREDIQKFTPITNYNFFNYYFDDELLSNIKIIAFDEIHALKSDCNYNDQIKEVSDNIDKFIKNKNILIGMTATDDDMKGRRSRFNYLLDEPFFKYKITNTFNIISKKSYANNVILNSEGKSLIMCFSAKEAIRLANEIPHSQALVSRYNELRTDEMYILENYIIDNKMLPDDTQHLFTTSMAREGFEFKEIANIKNVFVYNSDPVTIKQFVGRYRSNIENLYIVNESLLNIEKINIQLTKQQRKHHKEFKNLIYKGDYKWTKYFTPVVDKENIQFNIIDEGVIEQKFIEYMLENWIDTLIYTKEQKKEIVDYATKLGLKKDKTHKHTFNSLIKLLEKETGIEFIFKGELKSINNKIVKKYISNENKKNISPYLFKFIDDLEIYLNSLVDKKLYKEDQEKIKERLNCRQVTKINEILKDYDLSVESKIIREGDKTPRIWIINKI